MYSDEMPLTLLGAGTTRTLRPHWMLHELGLDYEKRLLVTSRSGDTQTDEFVRLNPKQKVPVLLDSALVLTESAAIVTYLADTYGKGSGLTPDFDTLERAHYNEWCFFVMMELDAHTLYAVRKHRDLASLYGEAPNAVKEAFAGFERQIAVASAALSDGRPFLVGETLTGADILLVSCLDWALSYELSLSAPLTAYLERIRSREAYVAASALNYSVRPDGSSLLK